MKTDGQNCHYNNYKTVATAESLLCISLLRLCWAYLVMEMVAVIAALIFSCGKATVGTVHFKKSHNGFHPCFTLYTNSLSAGTTGLYTVVVDTISLSYNVGGLGVNKFTSGIKERIQNVIEFPRGVGDGHNIYWIQLTHIALCPRIFLSHAQNYFTVRKGSQQFFEEEVPVRILA